MDLGGESPSTGTNSFFIRFALKEQIDRILTVRVQGTDRSSAARYSNNCGASGSGCVCAFYKESSPGQPSITKNISYNSSSNFLTCTLNDAESELRSMDFIQIQTTSGTRKSSLIRMQEETSLSDVLEDIPQTNIVKIYEYSCTNFYLVSSGLTGSGDSSSITCSEETLVSAIRLDYFYNLWEQLNEDGTNNFEDQGESEDYDPLCRNSSNSDGVIVKRTTCNGSKTLLFGLLAERVVPDPANPQGNIDTKFTYQINFQENSGGREFSAYAVSIANDSACPPGLVKAQRILAIPSSYTKEKSIFINSSGNKNSTRIELESDPKATLPISLEQLICLNETDGSTCRDAAYPNPDETEIPYVSESSPFCVIPKDLIP